MRVLFVLLCCVLSAVQGLSTAVTSSEAASPAPWLVNLRYTTSRGGLEATGGSLIASNWVLTYKYMIGPPVRMWVRFGALNVNFPKLVIETSDFRSSADGLLSLVALHRHVETTPYIAPVSLVGGSVPAVATSCGYDDLSPYAVPGEEMTCFSVQVSMLGPPEYFTHLQGTTSDDWHFSMFDYGTPLVNEGVQIAILTSPGTYPIYIMVTRYLGWIEEVTGLELTSAAHRQSEDLKPVHAV